MFVQFFWKLILLVKGTVFFKMNKYPVYHKMLLVSGSTVRVFVCHVTDPDNFYVQVVEQSTNMENVMLLTAVQYIWCFVLVQ